MNRERIRGYEDAQLYEEIKNCLEEVPFIQ
jgi:hypothetical protein